MGIAYPEIRAYFVDDLPVVLTGYNNWSGSGSQLTRQLALIGLDSGPIWQRHKVAYYDIYSLF